MNRFSVFGILLLAILIQGCMRLRLDSPPAFPTPRQIETVSVEQIPTLKLTPTQTRAPTEISPTIESLPNVTITAVDGNLNIRRGPDMAYNPISVLYKDTTAQVIAHDVLANWAQIKIPGSQNTGWVYLKTRFSKLDGNLSALPGFTPTDWPIAAYLRNCTHHQMFIMPGEITLVSSFGEPENEIWLYPGKYTVYDLDVPDLPEVLEFDIREGQEVEIIHDGSGEKRICS